jgi:hypothetical protein
MAELGRRKEPDRGNFAKLQLMLKSETRVVMNVGGERCSLCLDEHSFNTVVLDS